MELFWVRSIINLTFSILINELSVIKAGLAMSSLIDGQDLEKIFRRVVQRKDF